MDDQRTDGPAPVQQHQQYTKRPAPAPKSTPEAAPEAPVGADVPNMRALGRAEQDLSLYAAIIGHQPAVGPAPDGSDDDAQARRLQFSLHLNLPTRLHMPSLPSLSGWRHKQATV